MHFIWNLGECVSNMRHIGALWRVLKGFHAPTPRNRPQSARHSPCPVNPPQSAPNYSYKKIKQIINKGLLSIMVLFNTMTLTWIKGTANAKPRNRASHRHRY